MSSVGHHDYARAADARPVRPWHLLVLSARSPVALEAATSNLVEHLQRYPDLDIADVAFTLQAGRPLFAHRRTLVCRNRNEAIAALQNPDHERVDTTQQEMKHPPVAFVFTGEASPGNAVAALYETESLFAQEIDRLADLLTPLLGLDLRRLFNPVPEPKGAISAIPEDQGVRAVARFATEYALAKSWERWGVTPAAVMGYGAGEYAAACIAGVMEPEQAASLALSRARVLSGELEQSAFAKVTRNLRLRPARLRYVSSITGDWLPDADATDPNYWLRQRQWKSTLEVAVQTLVRDGMRALLQVDPLNSLPNDFTGVDETTLRSICSLPAVPAQDADLPRAICEALGRLYALGVTIDWSAYHHEFEPNRVPLPSYPFERHRCWFTDNATVGRKEPISQYQHTNDVGPDSHTGTGETAKQATRAYTDNNIAPGPGNLEATLIGICQNLLGLDDIGLEDNIVALGADSIFTMQLSHQIGEVFGVQISPHHLFVEPNIASLAKKLRQIQPSANRAVDGPERAAEPTPDLNRIDAQRYEWILSLVEKLSDVEVEYILRRMDD